MRIAIFAFLLSALLCSGISAAADKKPAKKQEWTMKDTVNSALGYSPQVKSRREGVAAAREGLNQARAGHLPRVDVQARTGFGSLPVSKYD